MRGRFVLVAMVLLLGCVRPAEVEVASGQGDLGGSEQLVLDFELDKTSLVVARATALARGDLSVAMSTGADCSSFRDSEIRTPGHFADGWRVLESDGEVRTVVPSGVHCVVAGPAVGTPRVVFDLLVTATPTSDGPARYVEAVRAPRPDTTPAVAFGEPWTDEWFEAAVPYYRALGFFAHYADDESAVVDLRSRFAESEWADWGSTFENPDLYLVGLDANRTWFQDLEGIAPGDDPYVAMVHDFARISSGRIAVTDVEEEWDDWEGDVLVRATVNGIPREFRPQNLGDWYDLGTVLAEFNAWLGGPDVQYWSVATEGQDGFVVVLTRTEAAKLETERAWVFL